MIKKSFIFFQILLFTQGILGQDTVRVTLRHYPQSAITRAFVPGTFNNWGPNSSGVINPGAPSEMTYVDSLSCYIKTMTLTSGSTENYKFHEHYNQSGSQWAWLTDPLNPLINYSDNNNSILNVQDAMIFQIKPGNEETVNDDDAYLSAGIFTSTNDSIDWDHSKLILDGIDYSLKSYFIHDLSLLHFSLDDCANGLHRVQINVQTHLGKTASDSTHFTISRGEVYFITPSQDHVLAGPKTIRWYVGLKNSKPASVVLREAGGSINFYSAVNNQVYTGIPSLHWGMNRFVVSVTDTAGKTVQSDTLTLNYPLPDKPEPCIQFTVENSNIQIHGQGNDPQGEDVTFLWSLQLNNASQLQNVEGRTDSLLQIPIPETPGHYAVKLTVEDKDGFENSTVNFFTVLQNGTVDIPALNTVPSWIPESNIYSIFLKGFTDEGTLLSAIDKLDYVKAMGFDILWLLPVMTVEGVLDQRYNIGYNIRDFYHVDPAYGTDEDFRTFVNEAHDRGLRVVLDVTPNHTSRSNAYALDVRSKKMLSPYYDYYQHEIISHNDNGLGQSVSSDGIVYYSGFSDALLNWNWSDAEARQVMLDVYTYWLREYDIDGFRLDVYWGPNRRYGVANFDQPLREALHAAKADILIIGETQGTGSGSELQYGDRNGGMDMGYDWSLLGTINNFPQPYGLHKALYNSGYRPGPNSFFMRFLENHDEDRAVYRYGSIERALPVSSAIFLSTGIPLIYQGQETGQGFGVSGSKEDRCRSTIDWANPNAKILAPHYQRLAQIRKQFPAFRAQFTDTNLDGAITSDDQNVMPNFNSDISPIYAFGRPYTDQNGLAVLSFSNEEKSITLNLRLDQWTEFTNGFHPDSLYFWNDLYLGESELKFGYNLDTLRMTLDPYDVRIFTISKTEDMVEIPTYPVSVDRQETKGIPTDLTLYPNFPNPFNPETVIRYYIPKAGSVRIAIYNLLGQAVRQWQPEHAGAGNFEIRWDGRDQSGQAVSSGIYLLRVESGDMKTSGKMMLIR